MQGRTAFLGPAHVNPALHTSAFTVVFFWGGGGRERDITRAGLYRSYDDYYAQAKL